MQKIEIYFRYTDCLIYQSMIYVEHKYCNLNVKQFLVFCPGTQLTFSKSFYSVIRQVQPYKSRDIDHDLRHFRPESPRYTKFSKSHRVQDRSQVCIIRYERLLFVHRSKTTSVHRHFISHNILPQIQMVSLCSHRYRLFNESYSTKTSLIVSVTSKVKEVLSYWCKI